MLGSADLTIVIATRNRKVSLLKTLQTIQLQSILPTEVIIVDASDAPLSRVHWQSDLPILIGLIRIVPALARGAATQRNQAMGLVRTPLVLFMDDDVILEPTVIEYLLEGINSSAKVGAVSSLIVNQSYEKPGSLSLLMYRIMSGNAQGTYAGKIIGPAWNLLPADDDSLPPLVTCEWLNTTCTLYRREALPYPVFLPQFTGYSLMEDVSLSVIIGRNWTLLNARMARIYHDSQLGDHKSSIRTIARMDFVNRYFVMTQILHRTGFVYGMKFLALQLFGLISCLRTRETRKTFSSVLIGKFDGFVELIK